MEDPRLVDIIQPCDVSQLDSTYLQIFILVGLLLDGSTFLNVYMYVDIKPDIVLLGFPFDEGKVPVSSSKITLICFILLSALFK
jgi:hypothetical protein